MKPPAIIQVGEYRDRTPTPSHDTPEGRARLNEWLRKGGWLTREGKQA